MFAVWILLGAFRYSTIVCNESKEVHTRIISSNLYFHILHVLSAGLAVATLALLVFAALIVQAVVGLGEFGQLIQSN